MATRLSSFPRLLRAVVGTAAAALLMSAGWASTAYAGDAEIRKALGERLPDLGKIDEVIKTPIAGLYEIRIGVEIFYTDEAGNYLIQGAILDTKSRINLTEERISKLTAIDFASLPLKDAIVWTQGNGSRKLVVFADPNCGYCKRFEREVQKAKDLTVYTFLYPILGGDSPEKARNIWCAKDRTKVWTAWMIDGTAPLKSIGECDASALQRVAALAKKHNVTGTPALVFEDGKRVPGAMTLDQLEKQLVASVKKP